MTDVGIGGAHPLGVDPFETLAPLAAGATVRIHAAPTGYAPVGSASQPWGSGFFVAPEWVLTCAHVALENSGEGGERTVGLSIGEHTALGRVEWAQPEARPSPGEPWPAPDLALIRLLDPVPHSCVWLSERTAKVFTRKEVAFFGWVQESHGAERISGRCTIRGELGSDGLLKLGNEDEMPAGASGGPVIDLDRGEVIGVLKARRSQRRDGGLAISAVQLRRLSTPSGPGTAPEDLYHHVMQAHDRHHADRHRDDRASQTTWTDAQSDLRATLGRALTPGQRAELLGLLAELPPPVSTARLDELVTALRGRPYEGQLPAPRSWRDGLGLLYGQRQGPDELEAVLRYAVHAATADRPYPAAKGAERRLWEWAARTAAGAELSRWFRNTLGNERAARLRQRDGTPAPPPQTGLATDPAGTGPQPYVLLEITPRGWERSRYDWRVCVARPTGELTALDEDFRALGPGEPPERLRAALAEAFRRNDEPGCRTPLHVALPYPLIGFPVEEWRIPPDGDQLGTQRPVVVRCSDPPPELPAAGVELSSRQARWAKVHAGPMEPAVLDCADGDFQELPEPAVLGAHEPDTVPVLCRTAATGGDPGALRRVMAGGFDVVLWRREAADREPGCADFHQGAVRTVSDAGQAGRLPRAVWQLRSAADDRLPEAEWSRGLALLYADPDQPLPGADDPLETP